MWLKIKGKTSNIFSVKVKSNIKKKKVKEKGKGEELWKKE